MENVVRSLYGMSHDAIFVGHRVSAVTMELRISIIEDSKVISNKTDRNCSNCSLVEGTPLRSSADSQKNFHAQMLKRLMYAIHALQLGR